jgi:hypothetical protein
VKVELDGTIRKVKLAFYWTHQLFFKNKKHSKTISLTKMVITLTRLYRL